jgi:hypothetical protein
MEQQETDLESLSIRMANRFLASYGFEHGKGVLSSVINKWAKPYSSGTHLGDVNFQLRSRLLHEPDLDDPPIQDITTVEGYPSEGKYDHVRRALTLEWIYRSVVYYERLRETGARRVERRGCLQAVKLPEGFVSWWAPQRIVQVLTDLSLDDALDLMSMLLVQWSLRFDASHFIKRAKSWGWFVPEDLHDYQVCRFAIYGIAEHWQLESICGMDWRVIGEKERERRKRLQAR